ncbi:SET and MYND domain-containing protein 4-like [Condylostylus longicornis]|uniref:SET and MYND domain-containing protein 4-like n=1 Tax=Condylostylus longicornis TaxID=2530218 RepID=UPI00244E0087|nr:SET and MYND domain-containing protein 4-like [Condylostylus longicornis]
MNCGEISRENETSYELYKMEGNEFYKTGTIHNFYRALNSYTKALYSSKNSNSIAIAHANRAAALIKLEYFQEAYDDCEAAIQSRYPRENIKKVYFRQSFCAVKLKDVQKIENVIDNLYKLSNSEDIEKKINQLKIDLLNLKGEDAPINKAHVQASDSLKKGKEQKILKDSTKGRFVVAGEKIRENETIMVEKAFAFVPLDKNLGVLTSHCETCAKANSVCFPCIDCLSVSFCSLKCQRDFSKLHNFECSAIRRNITMQIGIGRLALRTFLIGIDEFKKYVKIKYKDEVLTKRSIWQIVQYFEKTDSKYASVLSLNTNFCKMSWLDVKRYAATGAMLKNYLKDLTKYFEDDISFYKIITRSYWEVIVTAIIIRHLAQMVSNAHTIIDFKITEEEDLNIWLSKYKIQNGYLSRFANITPLFAAIYPRTSLYNHSCKPNFYNKFCEANLHVIANDNFEIGEEILNSYGKNCKLLDRDCRLRDLEAQYHFTCTCGPCSDKNDTEFKKHHLLFCDNCKQKFCTNFNWLEEDLLQLSGLKCNKCGSVVNMDWIRQFEQLTQYVNSCKNHKINDLSRIIDIFEKAKYSLVGTHAYKPILMSTLLNIGNRLILSNSSILPAEIKQKLIAVAVQNLEVTENIYTLLSLEYVKATAIFMDIILNLQSKFSRAIISYDVSKIKLSFDILSDDSRAIFLNYFGNFIDALE